MSSYKGTQGSYPPKGQLWITFQVEDKTPSDFETFVEKNASAQKKDKIEYDKIKNAEKAYFVGSYIFILKNNKIYKIFVDTNGLTLRNKLDYRLIIGSFELK